MKDKKELLAKIVIIIVYGLFGLLFIATLIALFTVFPYWVFENIGGGM